MRVEDELKQLPHIGPARAARLSRGLGPDLAAVLDVAPERAFATLRGVGPRQALEAAGHWRALRFTQVDEGSAPIRQE